MRGEGAAPTGRNKIAPGTARGAMLIKNEQSPEGAGYRAHRGLRRPFRARRLCLSPIPGVARGYLMSPLRGWNFAPLGVWASPEGAK